MLPFSGQGSNQAIEDAGALGYLFQGVETTDALPERLRMFESVRKRRVARVQIMSKVRAGKERDIKEELERYADPEGSREYFILGSKDRPDAKHFTSGAEQLRRAERTRLWVRGL